MAGLSDVSGGTGMAKRSKSSRRWLTRQQHDPYVERAQREGWRSRAVFKLMEIQAKGRILRPGLRCLDLGASPGSWSQFAVRQIGSAGRLVAVDLLPMEPIPGVVFLEGDFTAMSTREALQGVLEGARVDLVMSDIAPNSTGSRAIDQARSMEAAEQVHGFARETLRSGGDLLVKLFQGAGFEDYVRGLRDEFEVVRLVKPAASRAGNREIYLLARNYRMV
jgi:23S rRNA (uridine2552-2'-O)-methyltransferase